jgi:hypothetical protein
MSDQLRTQIDFILLSYPAKLGTSEKFTRLGQDLAAIVNRRNAWSRQYVSTAYNDSFGEGIQAGKLFVHAIESLARSIKDESELNLNNWPLRVQALLDIM